MGSVCELFRASVCKALANGPTGPDTFLGSWRKPVPILLKNVRNRRAPAAASKGSLNFDLCAAVQACQRDQTCSLAARRRRCAAALGARAGRADA